MTPPAAILDDRNSLSQPKITFHRISRHFRSIWLLVAILDDRKSLLIAFLAISDQYAIFFLNFFHKMTENHFRSHFSPFQINTQLFFFFFFFSPASIRSHFSQFQINTQLFFGEFFSKWPPAAILEVQFAPKNNRVLPLCVING